jgi:hypothetical protein
VITEVEEASDVIEEPTVDGEELGRSVITEATGVI